MRRNFTLLPRAKNAFEDEKSFEWPTNLSLKVCLIRPCTGGGDAEAHFLTGECGNVWDL